MIKRFIVNAAADQYNADHIVRAERKLSTIGGQERVCLVYCRHADQVITQWMAGSMALETCVNLALCGADISAADCFDDVTDDVWVEVRIGL